MKKVTKKSLSKAQKGKELKPDYSNLKNKGWNYFEKPTREDSVNYKKGFNKAVKGASLKQYPSPTSAEIKGYNEGVKKINKKTGGTVKSKTKK